MYKICYNHKIIRLLHIDLNSHLPESDDHYLKVLYPGRSKFLLNYLDKIEKSDELIYLDILSPDPKQTLRDMRTVCKVVKAAGGLVLNNSGKILLIHRRGCWDLPKGKMEQGETKKISAVREVQEETGLVTVNLLEKLVTTYHIYRTQGANRRVLKPTYWYLLSTNQTEVVPQIEEDIDEVRWIKLKDNFEEKYAPMYENIKDVINAYRQQLISTS